MWEIISFAAVMVVLMLLVAVLPHVFELPEAVAKYFSRRSARAAGVPPRDGDEEAARALGAGLRRAEASPEASAKVMAAFWAADAQDRRALAHAVAGMSEDGPIEDEGALLALLRGLRPAPETPTRACSEPPAHTGFTGSPLA